MGPPPENAYAVDPVGVASRDLRECLTVQLHQFEHNDAQSLALRIVATHLEFLARHDRARLARDLVVSEAELDAAVVLIRQLSPKPGARFSAVAAENRAQIPEIRRRRRRIGPRRRTGRDPAGPR